MVARLGDIPFEVRICLEIDVLGRVVRREVATVEGTLAALFSSPTPARPKPRPIRATIASLGGSDMAGGLTVDDDNKRLRIAFKDDKGDDADPPASGSVTWGCTGSTTLQPVTEDPWSANIQVGPEGDSGEFIARFTGVLEADNTTPIPDPAPLPYTIGAGQAVSAGAVEEDRPPSARTETGDGVTGDQPGAASGQAQEEQTPPAGASAQEAQRPLYEFSGSGTPDASEWPSAGLETPDGKPLYHFAGDTAGGQPGGASAEWTPYTGATQEAQPQG